jgi:hypothetical protein
MLLLSGIATFSFVGWLAWATTLLIQAGVPDADRASLISTLVFASTGVVVSAAVSVRSISENPLGVLADVFKSLAVMVKR